MDIILSRERTTKADLPLVVRHKTDFLMMWHILYEPRHDKTNKVACAPSKDSDQPGHLRCPHEENLCP